MEKRWKTYEEVAVYLLNKFASDFGLSRVENKQPLQGKSGATWEIDAKGCRIGNDGFVIVECRCYNKSKQNQEKIGSLAYRISDTRAAGGIVISPLGLQSGAQRIADAENIISITLDPSSTPTEFFMQFINKIFVGFEDHIEATSDEIEVTIFRTCSNCNKEFSSDNDERLCPYCHVMNE